MNYFVLLPVFVMVALTFGLLFAMGRARTAAVNSGEVRIKDIALGQPAWPARVTQIDRAYHNQLELPFLFYALVAMVLATESQSTIFVVLEWWFVAARLAHAFVHVTSNRIQLRFGLFVVGLIALVAMWLWFFARVGFGF